MDFNLRCNSLKCRSSLTDRAIVTTCSHIFCLNCANQLGLSGSHGHRTSCPACDTDLINPDDAVETILNPPEDYKTSVLSGLTPTVIMECAGRGLAFYSYQATQEIIYQEFMAKSLTDRYSGLSNQLDQTISEANSEISSLRNKISLLESEHAILRKKAEDSYDAFKEKVAAHVKIQKAYDSLKKRLLQSDFQIAADDAIDSNLRLTSQRPDARELPIDHQRMLERSNSHSFERDHGTIRGGTAISDEELFVPAGVQTSSRQPRSTETYSPSMMPSSQSRTRLPVASHIRQGIGRSNSMSHFETVGRDKFPFSHQDAQRRPLGSLNGNVTPRISGRGFGTSMGSKPHQHQINDFNPRRFGASRQ